MRAGEDPELAARRELAEELGVDTPLQALYRTWYGDEHTRYLAFVFDAVWDGPVRHQPTEVVSGTWMDVADLLERLADPAWPFTPDGRAGVQEMQRRALLPAWPPRRALATAAVADVACVAGFVLVGRRSHAEEAALLGVARTAWPFLVGLCAGWVAARAWRAPWAPLRTGLLVVAGTVWVAMVLRAVTGAGTAPSFVVVASAVLGTSLVGWRAVARLVRRHRSTS